MYLHDSVEDNFRFVSSNNNEQNELLNNERTGEYTHESAIESVYAHTDSIRNSFSVSNHDSM